MWSSFFIYMFDFLVLCPGLKGESGEGGREPKKLWFFGRVRKHYGDFLPCVCQNYTEKSISKFSLGPPFFWILFFFSLPSGPPLWCRLDCGSAVFWLGVRGGGFFCILFAGGGGICVKIPVSRRRWWICGALFSAGFPASDFF